MKVTKEILNNFKVVSISYLSGSKDTLCALDRIEGGAWTLSFAKKPKAKTGSDVRLRFVFDGADGFEETSARVLDSGGDWIKIRLYDGGGEGISRLATGLVEMEKKIETFGRRKEERIKIGKEKFKNFGLSRIEQSLFFAGIKAVQPCVVLDASVHGICVVTTETPALKREENFSIKLSFDNPLQTVSLKAHKVYSRLTKTESKTFATVSCQLLEPIHFAWKERVIKMIESGS